MLLKCEICEEIIARTEPGRLSLPLDSSMFDALGLGYVNPWPMLLGWLDMTCPHCMSRPFILTEAEIQAALEGKSQGPKRILTPDGFYDVGSNKVPGRIHVHETPVYDDEELEREWRERVARTAPLILPVQIPHKTIRRSRKAANNG